MSEMVRNRWGVIPPKSVDWSRANGMCDGFEFICRTCCDDRIEDVTIFETVGDKQSFWLSAMEDEGFRSVVVGSGCVCVFCESVVK